MGIYLPMSRQFRVLMCVGCLDRADIMAKGGVTTFMNVLMRDEVGDAAIADVISGLLSALAEGSADITHQVTDHAALLGRLLTCMLFMSSAL